MTKNVKVIFSENNYLFRSFSMDKNRNQKAGRPRLTDSELRRYWRAAKRREKNHENKN